MEERKAIGRKKVDEGVVGDARIDVHKVRTDLLDLNVVHVFLLQYRLVNGIYRYYHRSRLLIYENER